MKPPGARWAAIRVSPLSVLRVDGPHHARVLFPLAMADPWRVPGNWMKHVEMVNGRGEFISKWLGRNGLDEAPPSQVSRHWFGKDLGLERQMALQYGRRETDLKDCTPGATPHAPDAGQVAHSGVVGAHRHIHGDPQQVRLPADRVLYGDYVAHPVPSERGRLPTQLPCVNDSFYLGGGAQGSHALPRNPSNSEWRKGADADTGWMFGPRGGAKAPTSPPRRVEERPAEWGSIRKQPVPGELGLRLTDIHEGTLARARADPPEPAPGQFRRVASDVTLDRTPYAQRIAEFSRAEAAAAALGSGARGGKWLRHMNSSVDSIVFGRDLDGSDELVRRGEGSGAAPAPSKSGPIDRSTAGKSSENFGRENLKQIALADYELAQRDRDRGHWIHNRFSADYRHTPTDLHTTSYEETKFRQQDAIEKYGEDVIFDGRPKYGRRRSAALVPADRDLLPLY